MYRLLKKIHIYLGLLNFSTLFIFGIAGLSATFESEEHLERVSPVVENRPFTVDPNASDRQLAGTVYQALRLPLTTPVPTFALRRNDQNQLVLDFYTPNGRQRVHVLEKHNQLRIENQRIGLGRYFNNLHGSLSIRHPDLRMRLWGYYTEFSIYSLLAMSVSGVYLWLASRPRLRWAQLSFAAGSAVFLVLYIVTR
jgi:uncharacterized iron-regulated membrane protein